MSGKGGDVYEALRGVWLMCRLQERRWRGQGIKMLGMDGRRYKLWLCGKGDEVGSVGVMVMEELCEMVKERRDSVMALVLGFGEDMEKMNCGYSPQSGRLSERKIVVL